MTITSTANAIKSHKDPRLAGAVGVVVPAAGVLAVSGGVLAAASGGVVPAAGVLAVSGDVLAVTAGAVAATAGFAGRLRGCAGIRVG